VAVGAKLQPIPTLSKAEFKAAQHVYFDRCSGCHWSSPIELVHR
jgi:uncharacterized membrane protein